MRRLAKTYLIILIPVLSLVACKDEEKTNAISMEDFAGETGSLEEGQEIIQEDTIPVFEGSDLERFVYSGLSNYDTISHQEFHMLDRFTYGSREKINFKSKTEVAYGSDAMVTPRAELFYYTFSDTTKTKNAFYNWLDCFGSDCAIVRPGEDVDAIKTPPSFSLVYDTLIIAVDYRCEDANFDWEPFQDSLISYFGKDYNYRIEVGCGGPLNWK